MSKTVRKPPLTRDDVWGWARKRSEKPPRSASRRTSVLYDTASRLPTRTPAHRDPPAPLHREQRGPKAEHLGRVETAPLRRGVGEGVSPVDQDLNNGPVRSVIEDLEAKGQNGQARYCSGSFSAHVCDVHRYAGTIIESASKPTGDLQRRAGQRCGCSVSSSCSRSC